jgi:branched-chain amino acid transport system ATP-binding protein
LVGEASVVENALLGADVHNRASLPDTIFRMPMYRQTERAALANVMGVLELCGIDRLANDAAGGLSYGDQRRVEIARALATDPKLLLLDEPAAGMNLTEKARLRDLVGQIRMRGVTVLLIEHDMSLLMRISDEVLVLDHGVVISQGTPQEVRSDRAVIEAYLGTDAA